MSYIYSRQNIQKRLFVYVVISLVCGIFSAIYELFAHQVYSNFMIYAFAVPLVLGAVPLFAFLQKPVLSIASSVWQKIIHRFAIATLTVGMVLQGVMEIYGTTNAYTPYYFVVGGVLAGLSGDLWLIRLVRIRRVAG